MRSLYFEDLELNMAFRSSLSEPFTLEMIKSFEKLTGDQAHPPIVQGNLLVARSGGLLFKAGHFRDTIYTQAGKKNTFLKPLKIGERIYVHERIILLEDRPEFPYGKVVLERVTFNERHDRIVVTEQDYRILKSPKRT